MTNPAVWQSDPKSQALQSDGGDFSHLSSCGKCDLDQTEALRSGRGTAPNDHAACASSLVSTHRPRGCEESGALYCPACRFRYWKRIRSLPPSPLYISLSSISHQVSLWVVFNNTPGWFLKTCCFNVSLTKHKFPSGIILWSYYSYKCWIPLIIPIDLGLT